jgi:hypothetical protein
MKKIRTYFNYLNTVLFVKPINFINNLFDSGLYTYKNVYKHRVDEILPTGARRHEVISYHESLISRYYNHKKDRRNVFVFFLATIPTFFTAIFWIKNQNGMQEEFIAMIFFSMFITWTTLHMLTLYRRKVYKKAKQIIAFQRNYDYLPKDFILSREINYSERELRNAFISTTYLYRITVILVFIALLILLVKAVF